MLKIGITCYPSIGGSGILASELGAQLAARGHEIHFISYERPVRVPANSPFIHFHPVSINDYGLFKYPDYTLPLSVKMAEVSQSAGLDVLHVHYAVPHATAALLARSMITDAGGRPPKIVTTLHGTDTTLLGSDPGYGPAIRHALIFSDEVTTVSAFLERETRRLLRIDRPIHVIPNFFTAKPLTKSRDEVRRQLGLEPDEFLILHSSNLRPLKRIDLLLETAAKLPPSARFKLLILAGDSFDAYSAQVERLGLAHRILVRDRVVDPDEFLQAADCTLYASEMESFCLGILEGMVFGIPPVAFAVGGIPEVVEDGKSGILVPFGDVAGLAAGVQRLIADPALRGRLGAAARERASAQFGADAIVGRYEALYKQ